MLRRSLTATRAVNSIRRYRRLSKFHYIVKSRRLNYFAADNTFVAEVRARDLLRRTEQATDWVAAPLFPAGGAAGALLLYILIRALRELPIVNILELGAGQTTELLSGWASANDGRVVTFEHDKSWADKVAQAVDSTRVDVLHLPLIDVSTTCGRVEWYTNPPANILPELGFDLLVVDGPVGTSRMSRYGIVEHIPDWLARNWGVIWDDLDRPADLESFAALIERLRAMQIAHDHVVLDGDRTIGIIYTPDFSALRYMW